MWYCGECDFLFASSSPVLVYSLQCSSLGSFIDYFLGWFRFCYYNRSRRSFQVIRFTACFCFFFSCADKRAHTLKHHRSFSLCIRCDGFDFYKCETLRLDVALFMLCCVQPRCCCCWCSCSVSFLWQKFINFFGWRSTTTWVQHFNSTVFIGQLKDIRIFITCFHFSNYDFMEMITMFSDAKDWR